MKIHNTICKDRSTRCCSKQIFEIVTVTVLIIISAEEKLKDKLALAAREKLSKASREKQIQAERKRKAAMFINMLKSTKSSDKEDSKSKQTLTMHMTSCMIGFDV